MMATAESCTGGFVAQVLTRIPGSSAWFDRGFVTYSNEAKQDLVGVLENTLSVHGAVSSAVAQEMAVGAIRCSRAEVAVSITGIAGPDGGSKEKPVGTVWLAWADRSGNIINQGMHFAGDRQAVREASVHCALTGTLEFLKASG